MDIFGIIKESEKRTDGQLPEKTESDKIRDFLEALSVSGNVSHACKKSGLVRQRAYELKERDEQFRKLWATAKELGTDGLEDEANRRAFRGYNKPVYQGGKKVGTVREFSDTLMVLLLKANRPDKFKDRSDTRTTLTGEANGAPISVELNGSIVTRWADLEQSIVDAANREKESIIPGNGN